MSKKKNKKKNKQLEKKVKTSNIEKERNKKYLIAKVNDEFIITDKFGNHYEWLGLEKNLGKSTIDSMTLGILKDKGKNREIVLFTGEDRKRINRMVLQPNVILNLHNICRDTIGVGNYKVYNGLKIDTETGKDIYISSLLDFDVRKPIKKENDNE